MGSSFAVRSKLDEGSVFAIVLTNAISKKLALPITHRRQSRIPTDNLSAVGVHWGLWGDEH
ncbi:hypothetical protein C7B82_20800 [Stenomitos frigidus ULC18]|uniref:Uncharacterized protein n=2 Tax=Stenomitos TaxID=1844270 RepID=A0A2T1E043_9CYAN|nr:hypothetical protein C7B82_20800 [Stenomitos frigidus ULC18]